jgi:hypothetical protein
MTLMTDPVEVLREQGPRTAEGVAAACGLAVEETYARLVRAEAAGFARVKRLRPTGARGNARGAQRLWEAVPLRPIVGAGL